MNIAKDKTSQGKNHKLIHHLETFNYHLFLFNFSNMISGNTQIVVELGWFPMNLIQEFALFSFRKLAKIILRWLSRSILKYRCHHCSKIDPGRFAIAAQSYRRNTPHFIPKSIHQEMKMKTTAELNSYTHTCRTTLILTYHFSINKYLNSMKRVDNVNSRSQNR